MVKPDPLTFKYGQPLFAAAWPYSDLLLVAGGGGRPGSGIENRIVAVSIRDGALTDELACVRLKKECVRIAVSRRSNLILAVTDSGVIPYNIRREGGKPNFIMPLNSVVDAFATLKDKITAIRFSPQGDLLVLGTASGHLHIWDACQLRALGTHQLCDDKGAPVNSEVKDLDVLSQNISSGVSLQLCATTDEGECHVLDGATEMASADEPKVKVQNSTRISKPKSVLNGSMKHCRFSGTSIICSINYKGKGYFCRWRQVTTGLFKIEKLSSALDAAVTGMDTSWSCDFIGCVNSEGQTLLLDTLTMKVLARNKKAHMVFGTDVAFSPDEDAYLSVSGDASARVNLLPRSRGGPSFFTVFMFIIIILLLFVFREEVKYEVQRYMSNDAILKFRIALGREASRFISSSREMIGLA